MGRRREEERVEVEHAVILIPPIRLTMFWYAVVLDKYLHSRLCSISVVI